MIEVRCIVCGGQWDMDMDPPACGCENGWHQLRVDGSEWSEPVDHDGRHWHELPG